MITASIDYHATCQHCGSPLPIQHIGRQRKYCPECSIETNREHSRRHTSIWRKSRATCTCCHTNPVAKGNIFLCQKCFDGDGDDWRREEQCNRYARVHLEFLREYEVRA